MASILTTRCPRGASTAEKLAFYSMPEPNSGCQLWLGGCDGHGAAFVEIDGRGVRAARAAWEQAQGPLPSGAQVLHKCDNPGCINAAHLFLGNAALNMADRSAKNRQPGGEEHSVAITLARGLCRAAEAGERRILAIVDDPRFQRIVARENNISPHTLRLLKRKVAAFRAANPVLKRAEAA